LEHILPDEASVIPEVGPPVDGRATGKHSYRVVFLPGLEDFFLSGHGVIKLEHDFAIPALETLYSKNSH
jgi:hypothetical protein